MLSFFTPLSLFHRNAEDDEESNLFAMVFQGALLIGTAGVVSAGVLLSLLHCSRGVLMTAFVVSAGIWAVAALVSALKLSPFFIIPAVIFAIIFRAIKKRWHRIEFAAANLQVRVFFSVRFGVAPTKHSTR